jgi:hypothetical protein
MTTEPSNRAYSQPNQPRNTSNFAVIIFAPDDPPNSGIPSYRKGATFGKSEYAKTLSLGGFPTGTILKIASKEKLVKVYKTSATVIEDD